MEYPHITPHSSNDELNENFTIFPEERYLFSQCRKETNILGFAVLVKVFIFLGYPPRNKEDIPEQIVLWIARQLDLNSSLFEKYRWKDSVWKEHLASIRNFTGFRPFNADDHQELSRWLVGEGENHPSRQKMFYSMVARCRHLRLELPVEKEFLRLVSSAWQQYLNVTGVLRPKPRNLQNRQKILANGCF
jgi:hypothetical protein